VLMGVGGCRSLALLRHADRLSGCPFIGVDRKWLTKRQNDEIDPSRVWTLPTVEAVSRIPRGRAIFLRRLRRVSSVRRRESIALVTSGAAWPLKALA
jgi:hypothetical protein